MDAVYDERCCVCFMKSVLSCEDINLVGTFDVVGDFDGCCKTEVALVDLDGFEGVFGLTFGNTRSGLLA